MHYNNQLSRKQAANLWEDLFSTSLKGFFGEELPKFDTGYLPPINIHETDKGYAVEVMAPGADKADFKINVEKNQLTVSYEKKTETQQTEGKMLRKEFSLKTFKRSFTLHDSIDSENIDAKYENGILKVTLPKKAEKTVTAKSIDIA